MAASEDVTSSATADATPLPINVSEMVVPCAAPTPTLVLQWIADAHGQPWFPSQFAAANNLDRDAFDEPLNQLRVAELVKIATWVRGQGQGYVLTIEGEAVAARGGKIPVRPDPAPTGTADAGELADAPRVVPESSAAQLGLDQRLPLVVAVLLVSNVLWFFVALVVAVRNGRPLGLFLANGDTYVFNRLGSLSGPDLLLGEWWRLLSSCFVHGNAVHIISNVVGLALIGPLAELLWGRGRVFIIYAFSGLAGSCLAMALRPEATLVGASGAIWGVLTATLAWFMIFRDRLPPDVASDSLRRLMIAILLNAAVSFVPGISWEGHLGGALMGFATAGLLHVVRFSNRRPAALAFATLLMLPVLCLGGLMAVMKWGGPWSNLRHSAEQQQMLDAEFRANEARRTEMNEALAAFNRDVAPLVDRLQPDLVQRVEQEAVFQLIRHGDRRNAAILAEAGAQLAALKATADSAAGPLRAPTGHPPADEHLSRVRAFVEARSRSLSRTLALLKSPEIPSIETWSEWGKTRRDATAKWHAVSQR